MQCDASKYDLFVEVSDRFDGAVDRRSHSGDEALSLLEFLLSEKCAASVRPAKRARNGRFAQWEGNGFAFRNFLLNTSEVAASVGVSPVEVVNCIKSSILTAYATPNDSFWLVLKDAKQASLTHMRAIAAKIPMKRSVMSKGLSKLVSALSTKCPNFPVDDFGFEDVKVALKVEVDWRVGREYEDKSLVQTMNKLEKDGKIVRLVDSPRNVGARRWRFVFESDSAPSLEEVVVHSVPVAVRSEPVVAVPVDSEPEKVASMRDRVVEKLAGELMAQAEQRARELMGL